MWNANEKVYANAKSNKECSAKYDIGAALVILHLHFADHLLQM